MKSLYEKHNQFVINRVFTQVSKDCEHKINGGCKHPERVFTIQRCYADHCCKVLENLEAIPPKEARGEIQNR
jgi:hypothetical protein